MGQLIQKQYAICKLCKHTKCRNSAAKLPFDSSIFITFVLVPNMLNLRNPFFSVTSLEGKRNVHSFFSYVFTSQIQEQGITTDKHIYSTTLIHLLVKQSFHFELIIEFLELHKKSREKMLIKTQPGLDRFIGTTDGRNYRREVLLCCAYRSLTVNCTCVFSTRGLCGCVGIQGCLSTTKELRNTIDTRNLEGIYCIEALRYSSRTNG